MTSDGGARLLLLLAPWPGEGHYRGDRAELRVSASYRPLRGFLVGAPLPAHVRETVDRVLGGMKITV